MIESVVLLPGLGSPGWSMSLLACRLRCTGFETVTMPYRACRSSMEDICRDVSEEIEQSGIRIVSLVGHSMGGLLARALAARRIPGVEVRKVVMIGTPLLGSRLAGQLSRLPMQALPYGNLWPALSPEACAANGESVEGVEMGMIAGSVPGGRWIFGEDTDGIVPVSATRGAGLTGHATVAASHASLLLSQKVAGMTATFLAGGKLGF